MNPAKVAIYGTGVMGQGLARLAAQQGFDVLLIGESDALIHDAGIKITAAMDRQISRWGLTEGEKRGILSRIFKTTDYRSAAEARYIFEAIPEEVEAKRQLFARVEPRLKGDTLLITGTSTLSITEIGRSLERPERLIGMHFLSPVDKIPIVEIARGRRTDDASFQSALLLSTALDKRPIPVYEYPGFITTRIISPMINEAIKVLSEGVADCDGIDTAMKLGFGLNIGPFALADMAGLDSVLGWMENLYRETHDPTFQPCNFLKKMVRAGFLGVKSGRGFYRYEGDGSKIDGSGITPQDLSWGAVAMVVDP